MVLVRTRSSSGEFIVDLPLALFVLFILLLVPMLNLATTTYRAYLVRTAVMEAVHRAGRAQSFIHDLPAENFEPAEPSAQTIFQNYLTQAEKDHLLASGQLQLPSPALCCIKQAMSSGEVKVFTSPLPAAEIDQSKNAYFFELRGGRADVPPLLPLTTGFLPKIPGVTSAMTIDISARQMVESPAGLAY